MINALSIDVEDYFHVNAFAKHVRPEDWHTYPTRVGDNIRQILDMLDEFSVRATFFVLGWVAERMPLLVKEIHRRGHEIACHGYGHQLVYHLTRMQFRDDISRAKNILEDMCGERVCGYRAPSYSITNRSLWALDILVEEGFTFDSSIFPIHHDVYGIPGGKRFIHEISTSEGTIREFPLSTLPVKFWLWHSRLPIAGGGYLRLLPAQLVERAIRTINDKENQPVIVYFHPWEIDPGQPRIRAGLKSSFRHYLNLERMELKVRHLLERFRFTTMGEVFSLQQGELEREAMAARHAGTECAERRTNVHEYLLSKEKGHA